MNQHDVVVSLVATLPPSIFPLYPQLSGPHGVSSSGGENRSSSENDASLMKSFSGRLDLDQISILSLNSNHGELCGVEIVDNEIDLFTHGRTRGRTPGRNQMTSCLSCLWGRKDCAKK